jgi:hypothetical protein
MQEHGKTMSDYYTFIQSNVKKFTIKNKDLRSIIDNIFQPNREGRSINMEYIKGTLLKEAD